MRHFRLGRKNRENDHGQSVVEFALVLPVFALILFGVIEFGRLWMTVNVLTGAAREGARVAAISGSDFSKGRAAAQNALHAGNIEGASISIVGPNSANEIRVTVTMTYTAITGAALPGLNTSFQLSRSATMHWEG